MNTSRSPGEILFSMRKISSRTSGARSTEPIKARLSSAQGTLASPNQVAGPDETNFSGPLLMHGEKVGELSQKRKSPPCHTLPTKSLKTEKSPERNRAGHSPVNSDVYDGFDFDQEFSPANICLKEAGSLEDIR